MGVIFMHSLNLEHSGRNFVFSKRLGLYLSIYLLVPQTKDMFFNNLYHYGFIYK